MMSMIRNEKGVALISVYIASVFISGISMAAFSKSFFELKQVDREVARIRSFAAAEAGLQNALAQIGANAYTGFINTSSIDVNNFQSVSGTAVGSYSVSLSYPDQADWVIITATGSVDGDTRTLEGRVFLDSNLSKYLVYATTTTFSSGDNAQYGEKDTSGDPPYPEFVSSDENDRAALYFTGNWQLSGGNIHTYGDVNTQGSVSGNSTSKVHGDIYTAGFTQNSSGQVTATGVSGGLTVTDGYSDDKDRNKNGVINAQDYPDYHKLSSTGGGDEHKTETLVPIDHNFYAEHNNTPQFVGANAATRYLKFESINDGTATRVVSYTSSSYSTVSASYTLPSNAIVYVKGNTYVKGEIGGRVSIVSSNSIYLQGNLTYSSGQTTADPYHSAALLAKDKMYFRPNDLTVSGILYGENSSNSSAVFDAAYNTNGNSDASSKSKLRLYGNRIMKGSTNLSYYPDRVYGYDKKLKYFRPPGIPVYPSLRTVREA